MLVCETGKMSDRESGDELQAQGRYTCNFFENACIRFAVLQYSRVHTPHADIAHFPHRVNF